MIVIVKQIFAHPIKTVVIDQTILHPIKTIIINRGPPGPPGPSGAGALKTEFRTISVAEAAAKSLTLAYVPLTPQYVLVNIVSGAVQMYGSDYTMATNVFNWNGYDLDGILDAGDEIVFSYMT